ncbi:hypothetical protein QZH41_000749 [Actinostola sp. cb2023]|nr:hypothetical protein QZH41_000749 [Actinostola sp. cb2023]
MCPVCVPYVSRMCPVCVPYVSRMCPVCVPYVSRMCPVCVPYVSRMCPVCVPYVSRMCPVCVPYVSRMCPVCVPYVSRMCPVCVPYVSRMCVPYVSRMCPVCVPYVSRMCPVCVPYVSRMCPVCVPYVSRMCPVCVSYVSRMCPVCVPYVSRMCPVCVPYVCPVCVRMCPVCVPYVSRMCPPYVSRMCPVCVPYVSRMCPVCVPYVSRMCPVCVPYVSRMCPVCVPYVSRVYVPYVSRMCPVCVPYVSRMCPVCVPYVSRMCPVCVSYVFQTMEFTVKELNYFRVCNVVLSIVPEGLRMIFKQEWDALYTATPHGQWIDTPVNYTYFYGMESTRNRSRNQRLLGNMSRGDRREWDCTCLFYAIMYSDSVGPTLSTRVKNSVDVLRKIRNEVAHNNDASLTDADFQASMQRITTAFNVLNLDTTKVNEMKSQTSFPTKELNNIKQELNNIRKELEDEKKRNAQPSCFCVLPPKPSHDTIDRMEEVGRIYEEMNRLSSEKKGETTMVYLSGNPGCGKSVLARQIGEKHFDDTTAELKFITTINASTMDTLFESYVKFAGRLNCHPDCITSIANSKDLSKENQIIQLKALADKQVAKYSSWLMIVDNVTDLKSFSKYWPQSGEKISGKGQILVTTQDSHSITLSSHCLHDSLSLGMTHVDAMELLSRVSGLRDENEMMLKVAKVLDLQPLALSSAGVFTHRVLTTKKLFTWPQYLEKLEKGKREITEAVYLRTSLNYPLTMTAAVHLAVEREIAEEEIMLHTFEFLSVIAPEPIPLEYVVQYVMKCMPDQDEDEVASTICSSSLVLSSFEDAKEISVHQVVYHCLRNNQERLKKVDMFVVISSFSQLTRFDDNCADYFIVTRQLVNHMTTIAERLDSYVEQLQSASFLSNDDIFLISLTSMGKICFHHATYEAAKSFYQLRLAIDLSVRDVENNKKVSISKVKEILYAVKHSDHNKYIADIPHHETIESVGGALHNLGVILGNMGQYDEAKTYCEKALAIYKTAYGENHPSIGTTLNNLGGTVHVLGQYDEAKSYFEQALVIHKTAYGENHPSIGTTLNNLGHTIRELGQYDEAKTYYEQALAIYKTAYGENHPWIGDILNSLGIVFQELGHYDEAKSYYEQALVIHKTAYGENHPSIGMTLNNLGGTFHGLRQYDQAKTCYEQALVINKAAYGENHPWIDEIVRKAQIKVQYKNSRSVQKFKISPKGRPKKPFISPQSPRQQTRNACNVTCRFEVKEYEEEERSAFLESGFRRKPD